MYLLLTKARRLGTIMLVVGLVTIHLGVIYQLKDEQAVKPNKFKSHVTNILKVPLFTKKKSNESYEDNDAYLTLHDSSNRIKKFYKVIF